MAWQGPLRTFMFLLFDVDSDLIKNKEVFMNECSKCYPHLFCLDFLKGSVIIKMKGTPIQLKKLVNEIETRGFMMESQIFGGIFSPSTFKGKSDLVRMWL